MTYDPSNIFARILRGEIPNKTVYESPYTLAFEDINPQAPIHVLIIPKGAYTNFVDFSTHASEAEIVDFHRSCAKVCLMFDLTSGLRAITNAGVHGMQEVPHYHLHILGGRPLGRMIDRRAGE